MSKRRKQKGGAGGFVVRMLLFFALLGGGFAAWQAYNNPNGGLLVFPALGPSPVNSQPNAKVVHRTNTSEMAGPGNSATALTNLATSPVQTNETIEPISPAPEPKLGRQRPVKSVLEAQIALARMGISVGCIDGVFGNNMRRALLAWQIHNNLAVSGELDEESKAVLKVQEPIFTTFVVTSEDLQGLRNVPDTWLGKSQADRLDYETILEFAAEKGRASQFFIRSINPEINWDKVTPGTVVKIPRVGNPPVLEKAAFARVHLYSKTLNVFGSRTNLLAHYPCSIAAKVEKRPVGRLSVANAAANPTYLFNPEIFRESPEARRINRKLTIPPGPNNPVGTAWIGLSKPGYGIHGTPKPEQVGRTESHGCFRLANWNAEHLLQLAWVGMPVIVEP